MHNNNVVHVKKIRKVWFMTNWIHIISNSPKANAMLVCISAGSASFKGQKNFLCSTRLPQTPPFVILGLILSRSECDRKGLEITHSFSHSYIHIFVISANTFSLNRQWPQILFEKSIKWSWSESCGLLLSWWTKVGIPGLRGSCERSAGSEGGAKGRALAESSELITLSSWPCCLSLFADSLFPPLVFPHPGGNHWNGFNVFSLICMSSWRARVAALSTLSHKQCRTSIWFSFLLSSFSSKWWELTRLLSV